MELVANRVDTWETRGHIMLHHTEGRDSVQYEKARHVGHFRLWAQIKASQGRGKCSRDQRAAHNWDIYEHIFSYRQFDFKCWSRDSDAFIPSQVGAQQQQCDAITLIQHNTRHIHNIVHVTIAIIIWQEVVVLPVVEKPHTLNAVSLSPNLSIPGHHHVYKYRCIKATILDGNCAAGIIIMKGQKR